jgi:hypothetical protein
LHEHYSRDGGSRAQVHIPLPANTPQRALLEILMQHRDDANWEIAGDAAADLKKID